MVARGGQNGPGEFDDHLGCIGVRGARGRLCVNGRTGTGDQQMRWISPNREVSATDPRADPALRRRWKSGHRPSSSMGGRSRSGRHVCQPRDGRRASSKDARGCVRGPPST